MLRPLVAVIMVLTLIANMGFSSYSNESESVRRAASEALGTELVDYAELLEHGYFVEVDDSGVDDTLYQTIDEDGFPVLMSEFTGAAVSGFLGVQPFYVNHDYMLSDAFFSRVSGKYIIGLDYPEEFGFIYVWFSGGVENLAVYAGVWDDDNMTVTFGEQLFIGGQGTGQALGLPNTLPEIYGDTFIISFDDPEFGERSYYLAESGRTGDVLLIPIERP